MFRKYLDIKKLAATLAAEVPVVVIHGDVQRGSCDEDQTHLNSLEGLLNSLDHLNTIT